MLKDRLLAFLQATCSGRKNRMSGARLAKVFGISVTALRKLINQLRREHHPICSDRYGYFYAVTASEVYGTISHLYGNVNGTMAAIRSISSVASSCSTSIASSAVTTPTRRFCSSTTGSSSRSYSCIICAASS